MSQFNFTNQSGHKLSGRLELPEGQPLGHAIFAHCFTCSKNAKAASRISKELADHGIAVLRFDFTGLGNSEGDFANTNFSSNVDDLVSAAEAMTVAGTPASLLIGHSLGDSLPDLKKPLIIFHSPVDTIVSIENAREIYNTARHPKSFVSIDGADHMLDDPNDARFVAAMLATWADRYVAPSVS